MTLLLEEVDEEVEEIEVEEVEVEEEEEVEEEVEEEEDELISSFFLIFLSFLDKEEASICIHKTVS